MKLRTKFQDEDFERGEVVGAGIYHGGSHAIKIMASTSQGELRSFDYDSLADMYKDWEDALEETEESKKLKAWRRLKDKGLRLNHWKGAQLRPNMFCVAITGNMKIDEEAKADLDLLFGGEK